MAVVIGTMAVNKYEAYRSTAKITIKPWSLENRLGFSIQAERRELNHPRVVFQSGWASHYCNLLDEEGNSFSDDILLPDRPIYVLPMMANATWEKKENETVLTISVIDEKSKRELYSTSHYKLANLSFSVPYFVPKEPSFSSLWEVKLEIYAKGLQPKSNTGKLEDFV